VIFQYPGIGDSKSVKQARDMDIPEIWKHSRGINPYPGNGGNTYPWYHADPVPGTRTTLLYYYHTEEH